MRRSGAEGRRARSRGSSPRPGPPSIRRKYGSPRTWISRWQACVRGTCLRRGRPASRPDRRRPRGRAGRTQAPAPGRGRPRARRRSRERERGRTRRRRAQARRRPHGRRHAGHERARGDAAGARGGARYEGPRPLDAGRPTLRARGLRRGRERLRAQGSRRPRGRPGDPGGRGRAPLRPSGARRRTCGFRSPGAAGRGRPLRPRAPGAAAARARAHEPGDRTCALDLGANRGVGTGRTS